MGCEQVLVLVLVLPFLVSFGASLSTRGNKKTEGRISALEILKEEFPDLAFEVEGNGGSSDKNSTFYESVSNLLQTRGGDKHDQDIGKDVIFLANTIFNIMKWQGLIDSQPKPVWSLIDYGFDLLADFVKRKNTDLTLSEGCPYSFDTAGDLCLSADLNAVELTWEEARLYCQTMKGGDLAIFKDANQFHSILKYVRNLDPDYNFGFWIGASAKQHSEFWVFINRETVPYGTPFWGRKYFDFEQNPVDEPNSEKVFAILDPRDFHYLSNVDFEESASIPTVPLCQHFPGRGHKGLSISPQDAFFHQGVNNNIADKLTSIFSISNKDKKR